MIDESKHFYFMLHWIHCSWFNCLIDNNRLTKIWRMMRHLFWSCFVFFAWLLHYYHPKLHLAIGGVIHLSSLKVNDGYNLHHMQIQKLFSEFEICFHGFGGGAERMATVDGLYDDQCWISNSLLLFYNAVHNKQASVRWPSKNPVKHQPIENSCFGKKGPFVSKFN